MHRMPLPVRVAIVALAFWGAGHLSVMLAIPPTFIAPVWLPAAIGLVAILRIGYWALAGIAVAAFLVSLQYGLMLEPGRIGFVVGGAAGVTLTTMLQAALGRALLRTPPGGDWALETGRDLGWLILLGGAVPALAGAAVMTVWFWAGGYLAGMNPAVAGLWLFASSTLAVASLSPLILILFNHGRVSTRRKWAVGAPAVLLFASVFLAFGVVRAIEQDQGGERFARLVADDHGALAARLEETARRLAMLDALFAASDEVTPAEFDIFVDAAFGDFNAVEAVRWAPRVSLDAQGRSPDNLPSELVGLSAAAPEPLGVYLVGARARARSAAIVTGLQAPDLHGLIVRAVAGGRLAASPIRVVPDRPNAVILALPGFHGVAVPDTVNRRQREIAGLAIGVVPVDTLLAETLTGARSAYTVDITDLGPDPAPRAPEQTGARDVVHDLAVGDRVWQIVYSPTVSYLHANQGWVAWFTLVIGLTVIALLSAAILISTARTDVIQRLVERRTAETVALSRNLALILEHAADGILSVDPEGRCTIVNRAAADLLGYAPDELQGRIVHDLIHPVDRDGVAHTRENCPMVAQLMEDTVRNGVEPFLRKDGTIFPVEYSSERITDETGQLRGVVTVFRDISERQAAEAERSRFIDGLTRANEELERFAFVASHDLQEPLRLIGNFTGLLLSRYGDRLDESGRHYAERAVAAAARMQSLVSELLAYGRLDGEAGFENQPVDLGCVVEETLGNLREPLSAAGADISVGSLPVVAGSRARLMQLMQNLVSNAVKYRAAGVQPKIAIDAQDAGAFWRIRVADNGIGIPEQYRAQVFQPFKRLHSQDEYPGSGMGLAICRKIVESHSGEMNIDDNTPSGTIFSFTIPKQSSA